MLHGRGNTEIKELGRGLALTLGNTNRFSKELPLGEGWHRLILRFNHALTIGSGTTAIAEGGLQLVRGITLKSDRGERFVDNVPARLLYRIDQQKSGTLALLTAWAASTATYYAVLNLWFVDPLAKFPMDYVIDSARYSTMTLEITMGTLADALGTVGSASLVSTVDIYLERQRGPIPPRVRPKSYKEYGVRVPVDPNTLTEILAERASNLAYLRWFVWAASAPVVGVPWSGVADDATISDLTVDHDGGRPFETCLASIMRQINKVEFQEETVLVGFHTLDFSRDGSMQSALYSGDKSRLSLKLTNLVGLPSPAQVALGYEAFRPLA
jgi:hypothetical protein